MSESVGSASTQYGDMKGTASLDFHSGTELHAFARDCGVKGFAVAASLYRGESDFARISIYATDPALNLSTADEVRDYAKTQGKLPVVKYETTKSLEDFMEYVKRFDVALRSRILPQYCELPIIRTINEDGEER